MDSSIQPENLNAQENNRWERLRSIMDENMLQALDEHVQSVAWDKRCRKSIEMTEVGGALNLRYDPDLTDQELIAQLSLGLERYREVVQERQKMLAQGYPAEAIKPFRGECSGILMNDCLTPASAARAPKIQTVTATEAAWQRMQLQVDLGGPAHQEALNAILDVYEFAQKKHSGEVALRPQAAGIEL